MIITADISRIVYSKDDKRKVNEIVEAFGARAEIEDLSVGERYHYSYIININYDPVNIPLLIKRLNEATNDHRDELSFDFSFYFENEDYSVAPLFNIISIGNKASLYIDSTNKTFKLFCDNCNRKKMTEHQTIKFDTNRLKNSPLLIVDNNIIVSERLALKISDSDLNGYKLDEVEHVGTKNAEIKGFKITPTDTMPPQCIPVKYQNDPNVLKQQCSKCHLGGHLKFPYYYDPKKIGTSDFYYTNEHNHYKYVYRVALISKRAVEFLKKENIIKNEVRNVNTWSRDDWVLHPILHNPS
jgi:hypothetical protein